MPCTSLQLTAIHSPWKCLIKISQLHRPPYNSLQPTQFFHTRHKNTQYIIPTKLRHPTYTSPPHLQPPTQSNTAISTPTRNFNNAPPTITQSTRTRSDRNNRRKGNVDQYHLASSGVPTPYLLGHTQMRCRKRETDPTPYVRARMYIVSRGFRLLIPVSRIWLASV